MTLPNVGMEMPDISKKLSNKKTMAEYTVRWKKFDLADPADLIELSNLETLAMRGDRVVLLSNDKFTFMDKYFIVYRYMEKNPE